MNQTCVYCVYMYEVSVFVGLNVPISLPHIWLKLNTEVLNQEL